MNRTDVPSPLPSIPHLSAPPTHIPLAEPLSDPLYAPSAPASGFPHILTANFPFDTPPEAHTSIPPYSSPPDLQ